MDGHVTHIIKMRKAYTVLAGKREYKAPVGT
jgi:hypothetical protein